MMKKHLLVTIHNNHSTMINLRFNDNQLYQLQKCFKGYISDEFLYRIPDEEIAKNFSRFLGQQATLTEIIDEVQTPTYKYLNVSEEKLKIKN